MSRLLKPFEAGFLRKSGFECSARTARADRTTPGDLSLRGDHGTPKLVPILGRQEHTIGSAAWQLHAVVEKAVRQVLAKRQETWRLRIAQSTRSV